MGSLRYHNVFITSSKVSFSVQLPIHITLNTDTKNGLFSVPVKTFDFDEVLISEIQTLLTLLPTGNMIRSIYVIIRKIFIYISHFQMFILCVNIRKNNVLLPHNPLSVSGQWSRLLDNK